MVTRQQGMRRRLGRLAALFGGVTVLWACTAPSFPVPPPSPTFQQTATGWVTSGPPFAPAANARYSVFDSSAGKGTIVTAAADGSYTAPEIDGNVDDHVIIYYETPSGDFSESICRLLEAGPSDPTRACSP